MSIRDNVKECKVCKSGKSSLVYLGMVQHYNPMTGIYIERETVQCKECDTTYFFEEGKLTYRFYPTIVYGRKNF